MSQSKFVFELCAKQPFSEVGAIINMNIKTVEMLYYERAEQVIELPERYAQVCQLGIDELSLRKGKGEHCSVLTDLVRGRQVDIVPNRKKETLIAHFQQLGQQFCQQIKHVASDMWPAPWWELYTEVAREGFPQVKISIDRFHVVKALNDVLDTIRKSLRRAQPEENSFKKRKWTLFKRAEVIPAKHRETLVQPFQLSKTLQQANHLRNTFHAIFDEAVGKKQAERWLEHWMKEVRFTQHPAWNKFLKTLNNWKDPILNFVEFGISNAVSECCINFVSYVRRVSFGIPNFDHMRLRVLANSV